MRVALFVASLASLTTIAACSSATGLSRCRESSDDSAVCARLDQEFDLRVNETAYLADTRFSVQLAAIPEDSRCPTDVVCAWAGNARVSLVLRDAGSSASADVNSTLQPRSVGRFGYDVELRDVRPGRLAGEPLPAEAYVIRLLVRRASG